MIDIQEIIEIAKKAGDEILKIYEDKTSFESQIDYKADNSPLTVADKASHQVIHAALISSFKDIPVLSEEGKEMAYNDRKSWERFWLVDPLDGTKEFIKRNGEFTVNIALIENHKPTLGVIYAPVKDTFWTGAENYGAHKIEKGSKTAIEVNKKEAERTAVRSRSHASPEEEAVLQHYLVTNEISIGSSLKFCMVAEGKADVYYRHGPTMEWDTAAGQAILEAAGGRMFIGNDERLPFVYNKENLLNPGFLCLGW